MEIVLACCCCSIWSHGCVEIRCRRAAELSPEHGCIAQRRKRRRRRITTFSIAAICLLLLEFRSALLLLAPTKPQPRVRLCRGPSPLRRRHPYRSMHATDVSSLSHHQTRRHYWDDEISYTHTHIKPPPQHNDVKLLQNLKLETGLM